ncbi:MAG: addiction module protein [Planctomycetaceae bacterium]|nr:addiction module protein [Planctomycetaceae bacterium]
MPLLTELHIDRLSVEDRLLLVEEIWDSIAQTQQTVPLTNSQQQELERRLRDHEQNPDDVVSWEEVKAATLARLGQ